MAQEARAEIAAVIRWYARKAGKKMQVRAFRTEVREILSLLSKHPNMRSPAACGTRCMALRRFPFRIVYHHNSDILRIIALTYHSRRSVYWAGRQ